MTKSRLPFLYKGALGEEHPFEIALHTGPDLDELLGADTTHILAVDMDILGRYGFDRHHGQHLGYGAVAQDVVDRYNRNERQTERPADPAARAAESLPKPSAPFR